MKIQTEYRTRRTVLSSEYTIHSLYPPQAAN
jgi:hypothetical protein